MKKSIMRKIANLLPYLMIIFGFIIIVSEPAEGLETVQFLQAMGRQLLCGGALIGLGVGLNFLLS